MSNWIKVKDALPDDGQSVITVGVDDGGSMLSPVIATHIKGRFVIAFCFSGDRHISFSVQTFPTDWMPIPKPPEA